MLNKEIIPNSEGVTKLEAELNYLKQTKRLLKD